MTVGVAQKQAASGNAPDALRGIPQDQFEAATVDFDLEVPHARAVARRSDATNRHRPVSTVELILEDMPCVRVELRQILDRRNLLTVAVEQADEMLRL